MCLRALPRHSNRGGKIGGNKQLGEVKLRPSTTGEKEHGTRRRKRGTSHGGHGGGWRTRRTRRILEVADRSCHSCTPSSLSEEGIARRARRTRRVLGVIKGTARSVLELRAQCRKKRTSAEDAEVSPRCSPLIAQPQKSSVPSVSSVRDNSLIGAWERISGEHRREFAAERHAQKR
jgi:hypothetical protein